MANCSCPNCGHLHPKFERPAPYGNCGSCGAALPSLTAAAHRCWLGPTITPEEGDAIWNRLLGRWGE